MRNLTRKLFLSICTLAICAVTLVSTTFAWYTTTTSVTATSTQGTASGTTTDGSLQIAAQADTLKFASTAAPVAVGGGSLTPLEGTVNNVDKSLKLNTLADSSTNVVKTDGSQEYLEFVLYFRTDKAVSGDAPIVYIKSITLDYVDGMIQFENYMYDKTNQTAADGAPTKSSNYTVDITRALNLYTISNNTNPTFTHLNLSGIRDTYEETLTLDAKASAITYYNTVMKTTGDGVIKAKDDSYATPLTTTKPTGEADNKAIAVGQFEADGSTGRYKDFMVTFRVYLDGWDQYCFDACKGQQFTIAIDFTTTVGDVAIWDGTTA